MKVLMFTYYFPPEYSGSAIQALNLAKALKHKGIYIEFLTVNNKTSGYNLSSDFRVLNIKTVNGGLHNIQLFVGMLKLLCKYKKCFDIVHSHGAYFCNSFIGPLCRLFGKKSIVKVSLSNNDLYGLGEGRRGRFHKWFLSMVDRYVSISSEITEELKYKGFPLERIREIPNGVDIYRFYPSTPEEKTFLRKKMGLPAEGPMILYVGGISERKNIKWFVQQWDLLSKEYPGFVLILGPVSREDRSRVLYEMVKAYEKKLNGRLFVRSFTQEIEQYYRMSDIFVLPSKNEGMPNVLLEAMASGLPCVANNVSGAKDLINGHNGLLFEVENPLSFKNALRQMLNPLIRIEMGRRARQTIEDGYRIEGIAQKYVNLYKEVLGERV